MASITSVAEAFFAACETGRGWEACSAYCTPNATFLAQAEPLLEVKTLAQYTDWMKSIMTVLPDGHYEVKSFATDAARNNVAKEIKEKVWSVRKISCALMSSAFISSAFG